MMQTRPTEQHHHLWAGCKKDPAKQASGGVGRERRTCCHVAQGGQITTKDRIASFIQKMKLGRNVDDPTPDASDNTPAGKQLWEPQFSGCQIEHASGSPGGPAQI